MLAIQSLRESSLLHGSAKHAGRAVASTRKYPTIRKPFGIILKFAPILYKIPRFYDLSLSPNRSGRFSRVIFSDCSRRHLSMAA